MATAIPIRHPSRGSWRETLRLLLPLLAAIALVVVAVGVVTTRTARAWFESELQSRAELASGSVRIPVLTAYAAGDQRRLRMLLQDIVRNDAVVAAALCRTDATIVVKTALFPAEPAWCDRATLQVTRWRGDEGGTQGGVVTSGGPARRTHVSVTTFTADLTPPVRLVLLQDFTPALQREALVQRWATLVFGMLAIASSLLTLLSSRLTRGGLMRRLTHALGGAGTPWKHGESPLLDDVRALAQRTTAAAVEEDRDGRWNRTRLRVVLNEHVREDSLVIVANREPYIHDSVPGGDVIVRHPASGLVTALEPVMRACSGVWIAHGSGTADRQSSDANGRLMVPPGEESYRLRRVWMTEEEERGYYYGFANEGLWPVCHQTHARPIFRKRDWEHYNTINARFADTVVQEVAEDDPIVLVQDYHFALAPRMIRERLPRATIITFWHIPWPNPERFSICPWREELIDGLLGSSIVGFHTPAHCNQFLETVDTALEARIDRADNAVIRQGATTLVRPYPISVEWPLRWTEQVPPAAVSRREVLSELGLPDDTVLAVGVDRLDYTKGIEERIEAVERLLERRPSLLGRFVFVQLAAPSRTEIPQYQQLREAVEAGVERINRRFGSTGYLPVILLRAHHEPERVFRFYRAADMCYVSSLHDGMNLVSKEFVAARDDEQGVLILSKFAGAAHELPDALIVNPYDLEEASAAMERAACMPKAEQAERMRAMRAVVAEHNVYRWAGRMLLDAAQLRMRARRTFTLAEFSMHVGR
ncbi:MAG: trehalose-6-phosphate synthase [Gemmatimonadaceae bacterium]|nr:trehalose-6-phosphate synthase [Gemmatimonadaceae bacterium]